jgi:hypothetical protein
VIAIETAGIKKVRYDRTGVKVRNFESAISPASYLPPIAVEGRLQRVSRSALIVEIPV